jgi:phospholipase C
VKDQVQVSAQQEQDVPANPSRRRIFQAAAATGMAASLPALATAAPAKQPAKGSLDAKLKASVKNVVVIYLENRSFNNLFANFPGTAAPLSAVPPAACLQRDFDGSVLPALPKIWGGMVPNTQDIGGKKYALKEDDIKNLPNGPFKLVDAEGKPLPEAVITRDLWHLFYQNQMQINGGKNDGFAAWGNTGGMVMGYYGETGKNLGLWKIAEQYTLCDNFFMAAFGGSYLNHQFLISGRTPEYFNAKDTAAKKKIAVLDDGPTGYRLSVAKDSPASAMDGHPHYVNNGAITPDGYAVNTMAPPTSRATSVPPSTATRCWPIRTTPARCRRKATTPSATCCRPKRSAGRGTAARGRPRWMRAAAARSPTSSITTSRSTTSSNLRRAPPPAPSTCATAAWATARSRTNSSPTRWPANCRRSPSTSRRVT